MATWYLGPLGALVVIPNPTDPLDASPVLLGGVHQSLSGMITVDRLAQPRTWAMEWPYLAEDSLTYLEMVGRGLVTGPLRLIDPMRRNRLPVRVASGGSVSRSAIDFTQTGGSAPTWVPVTDPPVTVPVRGATSWQRTTAGAASLTTANAADRAPLVTGEQVRVSCWARGAAIQAAAAYDTWTTGNVPTRVVGTPATLATTTWTQLATTYTVAAGQVSQSPAINVASGQAASTLQVTGWQISAASEPVTWAIGGGAPTVIAAELTHSYAFLLAGPAHSWTMALREAAV